MTHEDRSERSRASNERLAAVIDLAVLVLGACRGFVVEDEGTAVRIAARRSRRDDAAREPSRSAVRTALAAERARVWTDLATDALYGEIASVRAMRLRAFAAAPLRTAPTCRTALLLDWSRPSSEPPARTTAILEGIRAIVAPASAETAISPECVTKAAEPDAFVTRSPAMLRAIADADAAARSSLAVLIEGETGTGKEAIARRVHLGGPRRSGPFVAVNCAAIPETLLEGELFGAVRGAYTGAHRDRVGLLPLADGGTIFLDEIGEMPPAMQAKLLRALQDKRVRPVGSESDRRADARVVTATHRDLDRETAAGRFRRDLFHRVAVLRVRLPPLRDRPEDLEPIVEVLVERLRAREGLRGGSLEPAALARLRRHAWPGNVRELESVLARALLARRGRPIRSIDVRFDGPALPAGPDSDEPMEVTMIREALRSAPESLTAAARRIGWTRQKLHRRMRALGVAT